MDLLINNQKIIEGIFIREEKNRFICSVLVGDNTIECYVPSSCRLGNFLNLVGKRVLLKRNLDTKARTVYSLYAVKHKRNYLLLRSVEANEVVANSLERRMFSFLGRRKQFERERTIEGYKTDIYLPESKTIIEIKSIITVNQEAVFPTVYSDRAIRQLEQLRILLQRGYRVMYFLVSLNPYVKMIRISSAIGQSSFVGRFKDCIKLGMFCKGYCVQYEEGNIQVKRAVKITF